MQLYILDSNYETIGMIDEAESVLWNKKYNDVGECEIYIPCDKTYISILRRGHYVYRYDDDMFCKIGKVDIETDAENGDHIIATAPDIFSILAGRIVRWQIVFSGTVGQFIKKVLTDNVIAPAQTHRKISNFVFDDSNLSAFSEKIEISTFTEDLSQVVLTTCKRYNIGFRVSYDINTRKLIFRLYRGKNKASAGSGDYVEFSPTFGNIINSKYSEDDSEYKNVAYIGYKSANSNDETVYLLSYPDNEYGTQGEARREIYVDGTNTSRDISYAELVQMFGTVSKESETITQESPKKEVISSVYYATVGAIKTAVATSLQDVAEDGAEPVEEKIIVTDYTYLLLIRRLGENALAERTRKQIFDGLADTINTYKYKTDYDLGDIVKVKDNYGNESEAQITEVMESEDAESGHSIEPQFTYSN